MDEKAFILVVDDNKITTKLKEALEKVISETDYSKTTEELQAE